MAGRGPAPADAHTRSGNDRKLDTVVTDGKLRGYPLPDDILKAPGGTRDFHPVTRRWWDNWRAAPQAQRMLTDADWDFLLDTALMHDAMWTHGKWELAAEVRLRVQKFGATPEDRARLGMAVAKHAPTDEVAKPEAVGATVTVMDDRRARIAADA